MDNEIYDVPDLVVSPYDSLAQRIAGQLKNSKDLRKHRCSGILSSSVKFTGPAIEEATPILVFGCAKRCVTRVTEFLHSITEEIFQEHEIYLQLGHPQIRLEAVDQLYSSTSRIKIELSEDASPAGELVSGTSLCGTPIRFQNTQTEKRRQATLGGILKIHFPDDKASFFGMTAAHSISNWIEPTGLENNTGIPQWVPITTNQTFLGGQGDEHCNMTTNETPDSEDEGGDDTRGINVLPYPWDFQESSVYGDTVTPTTANSSPYQGQFFDWALFKMEKPDDHTSEFQSRFVNKIGYHSLKIPTTSAPTKQIRRVILGSRFHPRYGSLTPRLTTFLIAPGTEFINVYTVNLDDAHTRYGDSGTWVVDAETFEVYGHVIAKTSSGEVFVVPFLDCLEDIKKRLNAESVTLPELTHDSVASRRPYGRETNASSDAEPTFKVTDVIDHRYMKTDVLHSVLIGLKFKVEEIHMRATQSRGIELMLPRELTRVA
ncbi:hypothetical protein F5Y12DRAFT_514886 [Xylaria sp. FL1777]|nr:hypothetical protein F5Y12DRAFT_514886 [Xylaria sp. FL1777]